MWADGSLPLPIIHILAQLTVLKSKFSQVMGVIINNGENVGSKIRCGS